MRLLARPAFAALLLLLLTRLSLAVEPAAARPADAKAKSEFLRLQRDKDKQPLSLETAIVRCAPAKGARRSPTVDLVAAVHIADPAYYRQLNREFKNYDAVLYELVASEENKTPRPDSSAGNNPVSLLQNGMKNLLDLEFQLKGIDYTRKNMVHADMSPEQFSRSMRERGESAWTMIARMLGYAMSKQNQAADGPSDAQLLAALFDKNRALALKRVLAEQFTASDDALAALDGAGGSTLISGRNQVALDVLKTEIAAGKKKIAIFYGAGHMPNMLKRLRDDFGMTPVNTRWLVAWDLKR